MEIEYQDIITLSDKNKYVVASKISYNNSKYVYLVDIKDNTNVKFAEIEENNLLSELDNVIDEELLNQIIPLFYNNAINDIQNMS